MDVELVLRKDTIGLPSLPAVGGTVIVNEVVKYFSSRWPVWWLPSFAGKDVEFDIISLSLFNYFTVWVHSKVEA